MEKVFIYKVSHLPEVKVNVLNKVWVTPNLAGRPNVTTIDRHFFYYISAELIRHSRG